MIATQVGDGIRRYLGVDYVSQNLVKIIRANSLEYL